MDLKTIQARLNNHFTVQADRYDHVLQLATRVRDMFLAQSDATHELQALNADLEQIAAADREAKELLALWPTLDEAIRVSLTDAVRRMERAILAAMKVVDQAENAATSAQRRLQPQISQEAQRTRMRQAYACAGEPTPAAGTIRSSRS